MKNIVVLIGRCCVGKKMVANYLKNHQGFYKVINCTTRLPENKELKGTDYYFKSEDEFKKMIDDGLLLEYVYKDCGGTYSYYGTLKSEFENHDEIVVVVDMNGARKIKETFKGDRVVIINLCAEKEIRGYRALMSKDWSESMWELREKREDIEYSRLDEVADYTVNNDINCIPDVLEIINENVG